MEKSIEKEDDLSEAGKWLGYLAVSALWFLGDLFIQAHSRIDGSIPLRFLDAFVSALIFGCVVSGVSDLWRRYVGRNYIGLLMISILLFAFRIWSRWYIG